MSQPQFDPDRRPEWIVEKVSYQYGLTCPECKGKMLVNQRKWLAGAIPKTYENQEIFAVLRSCTYCLRSYRIPARLQKK